MKTQAEKNLLSTSQGLICSKTKKVITYELKTDIHEKDTGLIFIIISYMDPFPLAFRNSGTICRTFP